MISRRIVSITCRFLIISLMGLLETINGEYITDWSNREIGHLLAKFIDHPLIAEQLRTLNGTWPFDRSASCTLKQTLDTDYRKLTQQGRTFSLQEITSCGVNQLTSHTRRSSSSSSSIDDNSHHLNKFSSRVNDVSSLLDRRYLIDNQKKRKDHDTTSVEGRVVGGEPIVNGAWPWLAAVGSSFGGPRCGGSLISDRWVVTGAHCFNDHEMACSYNVRLGSSNWLYDRQGTHVDVTVESIYRHPDFNRTTMINDVALLKLSRSVNLESNGFINAICLPSKSKSAVVGSVCLAAGWGRLQDGGRRPVEARQVQLPIITYDDPCGKYESGTIKLGMMCAGSLQGGRDTCQGDSGGPLTYNKDGRWVLAGLTSFGEGCAEAGYPGVYTDIGQHLNWVASVLSRY